jgi:hypothetical protein
VHESVPGTKRTYRDDLLFVRFRSEADTRDCSGVADFVANDPNGHKLGRNPAMQQSPARTVL